MENVNERVFEIGFRKQKQKRPWKTIQDGALIARIFSRWWKSIISQHSPLDVRHLDNNFWDSSKKYWTCLNTASLKTLPGKPVRQNLVKGKRVQCTKCPKWRLFFPWKVVCLQSCNLLSRCIPMPISISLMLPSVRSW